ncbi:hypothetical protein LUZ60_014170 [Juncus effusus]|nr:hypothetical protein LUZ60_014170 [Juncus effusus]
MAAIGESFIATKLMEEAYALLKDEVVSFAASDIETLGETFRSIQLVLSDAGRKRIHDEHVNKWLMDLKNLMYDADDVLDECRVKAEKQKMLSSTSSRFSPRPYFHKVAWGYQIKRRIQIINARLSEISTQRSNFGLVSEFRPSPPPQFSRKTSSLADPDMVGSGIDEDAGNLVELLIADGHHEKPRVHAIVGIGGIGKTTLARRIFNDDRITAHFHVKLWVSVTQNFKDIDLLRSIAIRLLDHYPLYRENMWDVKCDSSRDYVEMVINGVLVGGRRKVFLVLDDMWSEGVWHDLLRSLLQSCAAGSQVVITTRNMGVAEKVGSVDIHNAQLMSIEDGWALLRKKVSFNGKEDDVDLEGVEDIGLEIVKECAGLPLAIKAIGGVLCNKPKRRSEWEAVRRNSNWSVRGLPEGVHAALYLSYEDLPPHLKECFLYICLFPLAPYFSKQNLIHYWIAEGFIKSRGGQTLEEFGAECYFELLERGLIQPDPLSYDRSTCVVHDLLQSLAQFLAREESLVQMQRKNWITADTSEGLVNSISTKPRRLSTRISEGEMKVMLDFTQKGTYLRTLLLRSSKMNDEDLQYLVNTATRLRVLDLRWSNINKLPEFMGFLIHLRLLVLTDTTVTEIPESIGELVSLQYLWIQGCKKLFKLPKGIFKLQKLRCLDLHNTKIEGIPYGISQLQNLNVLQGFVISNNNGRGSDGGGGGSSSQRNSLGNWSTLNDLRELTSLKRLTIHNLERALKEATIGEFILRDMLQLEFLELQITPKEPYVKNCGYRDEEIEKIQEIFEVVLLPPSSVEILTIDGFFGRYFPSWFISNPNNQSVPQLRRLELRNCYLLKQLPSLGTLPNLDYLEVHHAPKVKTIGNEFLGQSSSNAFPKLTTLIFSQMYKWEEWKCDTSANCRLPVFSRLQSLEITGCNSLRSIPAELSCGIVPLKQLHLKYCNSLTELSGFPTLRKLILLNSSESMLFSGFPTLEVMVLENNILDSLPEWICQGPPPLKKLFIFSTFELLQKCFRDGLYWPIIQHIPYVHVQGENHYIRKSPTSYSTGEGCSSYEESLRTPQNDTYDKFDYLVRHWGNLE